MAGPGMQQVAGLNLTQTTILAPQLQQSLQILQAPVLELRTLVQQEMETNPVLEEVGSDAESDGDSAETAADDFAEEFDRLSQLDDEWRETFSERNEGLGRSSDDEERRQFFFDSIPVETTLQQHLLDQVKMSDLSEEQAKIAELLIGNIDDAGYLQSSISEISNSSGVPMSELEHVLSFLQRLHPAGVGARDLRECLLLQLERKGKEGSLEYRIISRFLDQLGRHRYPEIARKLGCSVDLVQNAAGYIAKLDPRPGYLFSPEPNRYVLPDASIEKIGDDYQIILNNDQIPHLRISRTYKEIMAQKNGASEVSDYIRDKIRGGKFLIKSIHQRQLTIYNICQQILERQRDFFDFGPSHLKPLTMVQVADAVGVHETTVSRAINGKYLATPHGLFEMRYFFTSGYRTSEGDDLSNTSVKEAIAELVRNEDSRMPLSDKEIVELLAAKGVEIARRTVAKYRDELNILPSNLRRKY